MYFADVIFFHVKQLHVVLYIKKIPLVSCKTSFHPKLMNNHWPWKD